MNDKRRDPSDGRSAFTDGRCEGIEKEALETDVLAIEFVVRDEEADSSGGGDPEMELRIGAGKSSSTSCSAELPLSVLPASV